MLALLLLVALPSSAHASATKLDTYRCNGLAGHAGVSLTATDKERPFYVLDGHGALLFDRDNPRSLLISAHSSPSLDEVAYFEAFERGESALRLGEGLGEHGVIRVNVRLQKQKGRPTQLEETNTFYSLDSAAGWDKIRRGLRNKTLSPKKNERTRETESWIQYEFSGLRCYVSQEGEKVHGRKLVSFDQTLCNQVLRITDRDPVDILYDFRHGDTFAKNEANRVLRLIRDAQVARDEQLKRREMRLLSVEGPPEQSVAGMLPPEDSAALQELRACVAALGRNGLQRPEAQGRERMDFMGNEPGLELDPPAGGGEDGN